MSKPHIAILGSGPTGLEMALAAAENGHPFTIYEAAATVAGHIHDWRHVRLFTPWSMNVSSRMHRALQKAGYELPTGGCPTGGELIDQLYGPLASSSPIAGHVQLDSRVTHVGRQSLLKHEEISSARRAGQPFRLLVESSDGEQRLETADLVFDCTGNSEPNALGDGGIPAPGEERAASRIVHQVPDLEQAAADWAGQRTLLIGSGHSAQTALRGLLSLIPNHPETRIVWALRGHGPSPEADDPLPERESLTRFAAEVYASPPPGVEVLQGKVVDALLTGREGLGVDLRSPDGSIERIEVDRVLALTGRVGDHRLYRQLQVHECYATSGPMKLAGALMASAGGGGDCLAQTSLGPETLKNPEPGFFILGSKSYGRRNDYLMRVGWQQVDEVFELLD